MPARCRGRFKRRRKRAYTGVQAACLVPVRISLVSFPSQGVPLCPPRGYKLQGASPRFRRIPSTLAQWRATDSLPALKGPVPSSNPSSDRHLPSQTLSFALRPLPSSLQWTASTHSLFPSSPSRTHRHSLTLSPPPPPSARRAHPPAYRPYSTHPSTKKSSMATGRTHGAPSPEISPGLTPQFALNLITRRRRRVRVNLSLFTLARCRPAVLVLGSARIGMYILLNLLGLDLLRWFRMYR